MMVNSLDRYDTCIASCFISARGMTDVPPHRILMGKKARSTEIPFLLVNWEIGTSKLRYIKTIPKYLKHILHLLAIQWL